jgi:hypothetical protein
MTREKFQAATVRVTGYGLERIVPHQQSLQVNRLANGVVVVSYVETGRDTVMFELTPQQAAELASLLQKGN